jgi:hypothetical protein
MISFTQVSKIMSTQIYRYILCFNISIIKGIESTNIKFNYCCDYCLGNVLENHWKLLNVFWVVFMIWIISSMHLHTAVIWKQFLEKINYRYTLDFASNSEYIG